MGTIKENLGQVSLSQLSQLTGCGYRTIKKRLTHLKPVDQDKKTLYYDPKSALPLIYGFDPNAGSEEDAQKLDPVLQGARLSRARADKTELEIKILEGELVRAVDVESEWSNLVMAFRAKMRSLPSKAAPRISRMKDASEIQEILRELTDEALTELAGYDPDDQKSHSDGGEESLTTPEADT